MPVGEPCEHGNIGYCIKCQSGEPFSAKAEEFVDKIVSPKPTPEETKAYKRDGKFNEVLFERESIGRSFYRDLKNVDPGEHKAIALKLIEAGHERTVAEYFSYFKGINEADHEEIARKIAAKSHAGKRLIVEEREWFTGLDDNKMANILGMSLKDYIEHRNGIDKQNEELAAIR